MLIETWLNQNINSRLKHVLSGNEIHVCCPLCGDTRYRMYINTVSGLVYCHNCQYKGNIVRLVADVEHIPVFMARQKIQSAAESPVEGSLSEYLLTKHIYATPYTITKRSVKLPEEFKLLHNSSSCVANQAKRYLYKRGITAQQIESHGMGYCTSGEYDQRVIIPIVQEDQMKFWVARRFNTTVYPKEKSPHSEFYQWKKSEVIFNLDTAVKTYNSLVICEGIFDALSWGNIGVALLGKTLYEPQLVSLLQYRDLITDGVYVCLDADATESTIKLATELSQYFETYVITIPEEFDDPNYFLVTHSKQQLWKLFNIAKPWEEFSGVRLKLTGAV